MLTPSDDVLALTGSHQVARWNIAAPLGTPVVVTYSFAEQPADYDRNDRPGFVAFNDAQRDYTRIALDTWAAASGLEFVEVPDSIDSNVRFSMHDMSGLTTPSGLSIAAFAYYPGVGFPQNDISRLSATTGSIGGDVFMNAYFYGHNSFALMPGQSGYSVLLHEIGHAIGFEHPFEGDHVIDPHRDNADYTVLSYNRPSHTTQLGSVDIEASQFYYGTADYDHSFDAETLTLTIDGTAKGEWLLGTSLRDIISGEGGNDTILGEGGDDLLTGGAGSDRIDGGTGRDTAIYAGNRAEYSVSETAGQATVEIGGMRDVLTGIESLQFADRIVFLDERRLSREDAATVAYLYEAGLDRDGAIDLPGLNFWIGQREAGMSELALAQAFLDSDEFRAVVGNHTAMSDRQLVEALYRNVLNRDGEAAGVDFWTDAASDPAYSDAHLLLAFAESPENVTASPGVAALIETEPGLWDFMA